MPHMVAPFEFPKDIVAAAFDRAGGRCECRLIRHGHYRIRCNKRLAWKNRGRNKRGPGRWEAHHKNANGRGVLSNCEIHCVACHAQTYTFGRTFEP
jgi:hypothetical protein